MKPNTETKGLERATRTTIAVEVSSRTSINESKNPPKLRWGQVVAMMSQSKRPTIKIALARKDFRPTRTAGSASKNDKALHMGAAINVSSAASVISAVIKTAGIHSPT